MVNIMSSIKLKNVRLSFPSLWETEVYQGTDTGKFSASFLIGKDDPQAAALKAAMMACAEAKWGKPLPKKVQFSALKDGDATDYDGYAGHISMKGTTKRRPVIIDRDKTPLTEEDNRLYAGCRVNAVVSFWAMDNQYGKKVLGNIEGIQFNTNDEPFGAGNNAMDDFDDLGDDEADAAPAPKAKAKNKAPTTEETAAEIGAGEEEDPFDF